MSMSTQRESQQPKPIPKNASSFSQRTSLLCLVTSLNFNDNLGSSFKNECNPRALDPRLTALDAITAILVQEHEVLAACYTSDSETVSVISTETDVIPYTDIVGVDIATAAHIVKDSISKAKTDLLKPTKSGKTDVGRFLKIPFHKEAAAFLKLALVKVWPLFGRKNSFSKGPAAFLKLALVKVRPHF